jgi:polyphosphate glucokinase
MYTPSLVVLGRGISKKYNDFKQHLTTDIKIKVAEFRNNAGIIGAAIYASKKV